MFGHQSKPTRIWTFGAGEPVEGLEVALEQLRLAGCYRNLLCELELARRAAVAETVRRLRPALAAMEEAAARADAELETALAELRRANRDERSRAPARALREGVQPFRAARRVAWQAFRAARKEAYASPDVREALDAVGEDFAGRRRLARGESDLYWGNYLAVEQACASFGKGPPPRFRGHRGEGRCVVQVQKGMDVPTLLSGSDQRVRLHRDRVRPDGRVEAWLMLRAGTAEDGRSPVWVRAPVVLHRDLPPDARIKWAWLRRVREHGTHYRWDLQLSLARDSWDNPDWAREGSVGLDLGWRLLPEQADGTRPLRLLTWVGSDGDRGEVVISARKLGRWAEVERVRAVRDRLFDQARDWLAAWLAERPHPEWLAERARDLPRWKSPARLAGLVLHWRENRFAGDSEAFERLEGRRVQTGRRMRESGSVAVRYAYTGWRRQDKHLFCWERAVHEKAVAFRNDLVRKAVAALCRRYRTATIEDIDWREFMRLPEVDGDDPLCRAARRNRQIAAPGRTAQIVREGFAAVRRVPPQWTTVRCHHCGRDDPFDAARWLERRCRHCDWPDDQDYRAASNLLTCPDEGMPRECPRG